MAKSPGVVLVRHVAQASMPIRAVSGAGYSGAPCVVVGQIVTHFVGFCRSVARFMGHNRHLVPVYGSITTISAR